VRRYGPVGVFSARFIAGLRFIAGPVAGAMSLRFLPFAVANVSGAVAFVSLSVGAGYAIGYGFGDYVERARRAVGAGGRAVLIAAVVCAGAGFVWRLLRALRARSGS
jgi:membrane protein DedA with SNARE-associated domain